MDTVKERAKTNVRQRKRQSGRAWGDGAQSIYFSEAV